jgi:DNA-binding NarL/FixJ family response regulator
MRLATFILIIDSYVVRKGLLAVLNRIQGVRVLREFSKEDPFINYLNNHQVDHILMGQNEFDHAAESFMKQPELLEKTILIQGHGQKQSHGDRQKREVQTIIHLEEDKESIMRKIRDLLDLKDHSPYELAATKLSPRETTIVRLVSMGLTNRQIAEKLFLSTHTVMTHRKNISSKLGIKSVSGLTIYAIVNNIITLEEVSSLAAK